MSNNVHKSEFSTFSYCSTGGDVCKGGEQASSIFGQESLLTELQRQRKETSD